MLSENDIRDLKHHRHLIACMIDNSIGYFTPVAALRAIQAYKNNEPCYCELYMDIFYKKLNNNADLREEVRKDPTYEIEKALYKNINRDYIRDSKRYSKYESHKICLAIVDRNIKGNESIGASWF